MFYLSVFLTGALLKTQKIFWCARLRGLAVAACSGHACGAGPNFGPVGPPLRMLRPGRSGPLWVSLCSGRAGRGLWVCSVGRADRPGLLPNAANQEPAEAEGGVALERGRVLAT